MISILLTVKITLINIKFYNLKAAGKRSHLNAPAAFLLPAILFAPPAQPLSRKSPSGYSQDHAAPLAPLVMISPAASLAAICSIARHAATPVASPPEYSPLVPHLSSRWGTRITLGSLPSASWHADTAHKRPSSWHATHDYLYRFFNGHLGYHFN